MTDSGNNSQYASTISPYCDIRVKFEKSNQTEIALMALTLMMLPLMVLAVKKNIFPTVSEQPSKILELSVKQSW